MSTPIYDRLLAEFRSLHYGRNPGTDRVMIEKVRDIAVSMARVRDSAQKAGVTISTSMTAMKAAQTKASQPRDPRLTTKRGKR